MAVIILKNTPQKCQKKDRLETSRASGARNPH